MSICLNMIVKNESAIITRLLESVYNIIDTYCICDTGSTDNTKELIMAFFNQKNAFYKEKNALCEGQNVLCEGQNVLCEGQNVLCEGQNVLCEGQNINGKEKNTKCNFKKIVGKIIDEPFVNFEHNRNVALASCFGMADYVLFLDADMVLEINPNFKLKLVHDAYYLHQGNEDIMGKNIRIIKNDGTFKYYGVTHEVVMTTRNDTVTEHIQKSCMFIRDIGDGGAKQDKFTRDKRLLLEAIEKEPYNSRYPFYLANTFKALNDMPNAVKYYKKRIELEEIRLHKFTEEVYYSYYNIGLCLNNEESVHYWLMAHENNPKRVEHLYELIKFYRLRKEYPLCKLFYDMAHSNLAPPFRYEDAHNYIFSSIIHYRFLIDYEYTLFACYLGIKTANYSINRIFNNCDEKDNAYTNTLSNIKYYKNILKPIIKLDFTEQIQINNNIDMISSSASIIPYLTGYLMNTRFVNYSITESGAYVKYGTINTPCDNIITVNKCSILDSNFKMISSKFLNTIIDNKYIVGIEDVKIHRTNDNKLVYLGSAQYENTILMKYGNYDIDNTIIEGNFITCDFIKSVKEKNWVFVPNNKNEIIYKWHPLTLCTINNNTLSISRIIPTPKIFTLYRGSSSGCVFGDEIWFVVHFVSDETVRYYYNAIVVFDKDMRLLRYSPPFNFGAGNIEFCLSIGVEEDRVILPHSLNDGTTYIGLYDKNMIDAFIKQ